MRQQQMKTSMLFFHALTPLHTSTGQSVDVIDLPVAREKVTNWPLIPGSSIKGVLRDACPEDDQKHHYRAFGPDTDHASDAAGNLLFADARLLCFPVRSFAGVFAWVTCPSALQRLGRDCSAGGIAAPWTFASPQDWAFESAVTCNPSHLIVDLQNSQQQQKIVIEEYDLNVVANNVDELAGCIAGKVFPDQKWQGLFKQRFAVIHDDMFTILTETATEVAARIRLDEKTKTVAKGALWYEEAVPAEAIFYCPLMNAERKDGDDLIADYIAGQKLSPVQIGGNASVGRGLMRVCLDGKELTGTQK